MKPKRDWAKTILAGLWCLWGVIILALWLNASVIDHNILQPAVALFAAFLACPLVVVTATVLAFRALRKG